MQRKVFVAGVGMIPFVKPGASDPYNVMGATATRAAAAGGVTTILDMPLNSIPATTTVAALEAKRRAAERKSVVNVGFIGGVVPGNPDQIEPLARAGVRAFKCFLSPSGVDEFLNVSEEDLKKAFPAVSSAFDNVYESVACDPRASRFVADTRRPRYQLSPHGVYWSSDAEVPATLLTSAGLRPGPSAGTSGL